MTARKQSPGCGPSPPGSPDPGWCCLSHDGHPPDTPHPREPHPQLPTTPWHHTHHWITPSATDTCHDAAARRGCSGECPACDSPTRTVRRRDRAARRAGLVAVKAIPPLQLPTMFRQACNCRGENDEVVLDRLCPTGRLATQNRCCGGPPDADHRVARMPVKRPTGSPAADSGVSRPNQNMPQLCWRSDSTPASRTS